MTPEQAKPYALDLLEDLGSAIGDKAAIQSAINRAVDRHPQNWPLVLACALAWTFADYVHMGPETAVP